MAVPEGTIPIGGICALSAVTSSVAAGTAAEGAESGMEG
jgi:hypothetical protein